MDAYLEALKERDSWNVDFSFNYVRDTNVNNVGEGKTVALNNGGTLTRSESMMPQTAHGLAYSLDISRDFIYGVLITSQWAISLVARAIG